MSVLSNYAANTMLNALLYNHNTYIGLHITDPGVLGDYGSEVSGGSYIRQAVTFSDAGSRSSGNTTQATFTDMPAVIVSYIGVWDASTTGNLIAYKALASPITVADGYTFTVPASSLVISFS